MKFKFSVFFFLICQIYVSHSDKNIYCNSDQSDDNEVFNYDCSGKELTWFKLTKLIDHVRGSSSLNLALNNFYLDNKDYAIHNLSFNLFKQLNKKFNLSYNLFNRIDSHAFYYTEVITDNISLTPISDSQLKPLLFEELDLSNNSFQIIPWNSLKKLPRLTQLYLNSNPLKRFDLGDLTFPHPGERYFRQLTEVYANSSKIEFIDPRIFTLIENLQILDLANNHIRHIDNFAEIFTGKFFVNHNPLICDCKLIWLKRFLREHGDPSRENFCFINTKSISENIVVDSKSIFLNSSYSLIKDDGLYYSKAKYLDHLALSRIPIEILTDDQFFCDLELDGQIENLSLVDIKTKTIRLDCKVTAFPEPKIKWLLGSKDLYKIFSYENKNFLFKRIKLKKKICLS